jgi:hypothetical protein
MSERVITIDDIYELFRESERQRQAREERYEQERQAREERLERERQAQEERLERERQAQEERYEQERQAQEERYEQERQAQEERLEQERQAEKERYERLERERQAQEERYEQERQRYEQERQRYEQERQRYERERQAQEERYQARQERYQERYEQEMEELRKLVARTNKQVSGIANRWGEFVENLVRPAAVTMFREQGIQVHHTALNVIPESGEMEIDILAENTNEAVVIEVKSHLQARDVKRFIKTLAEFKTVFPKYQDHCLYGAMAGIKVGTKAEKEAEAAGLFVIKPAGNTVMITNPPGFKPRIW